VFGRKKRTTVRGLAHGKGSSKSSQHVEEKNVLLGKKGRKHVKKETERKGARELIGLG